MKSVSHLIGFVVSFSHLCFGAVRLYPFSLLLAPLTLFSLVNLLSNLDMARQKYLLRQCFVRLVKKPCAHAVLTFLVQETAD